MSKKSKEVVGFSFQEIPLEEARNAVLAGDGNYSEIKEKLLEKLPLLAPDKAFAFGLPNGKEVPEDQRRGLCMAINSTLKHANIMWRVTYSGNRKLFLCVPRSVRHRSKGVDGEYTPRSKFNQLDNSEILKLWREGLSVSKIEQQTGADIQRIKYVCYQMHPRRPRANPTHPGNGKMPDDSANKEMEIMIAHATRRFKVTPEDIIKGNGKKEKAVRKAICVVAAKRNIAPRVIAPYVGISKGGVKFNAHQSTQFAKEEIAELQEVLGRN